METGSKKHIIAERLPDTGVVLSLCNLFVYDIAGFKVLSLYSSLSKRLEAYKILTAEDAAQDTWLNNMGFNAVYHASFNPDFDLVPSAFQSSAASNYGTDFTVQHEGNGIHILYGIQRWMQDNIGVRIFIASVNDILTVVVYQNSTCLFANSFSYKDQTELLYFVVNAMQVSGVKQEETTLVLDYHCSHKYGLVEFLSPYFQHVQSLKVPFEDPDPEIEDLPELLMPNHLIALCV